MKIYNVSKQSTLCTDCKTAKTFFTRFAGLMGKSSLPEGSGLLIVPCNSIHMFFMRMPLDIIFIDKNNVVVNIIESIKPWKVSSIVPNSHSVLELPEGTIKKSSTALGDRMELLE